MSAPSPLEHLDGAWVLPCDGSRVAACDRPAEWILWFVRCCPDVPGAGLFCGVHRATLMNMTNLFCHFCARQFVPGRAAFDSIALLNPSRKVNP